MPIRITTLPDGTTEVIESGDGTPFDDTITGIDSIGFPRSEVIRGFAGSDQLFGGRGRDLIKGGFDNDHIYGGRGRDTLKGGAGADIFYYEWPRDGRDWIKDFVPGEDFIFLAESVGFLLGADALGFVGKRLTYDYDGPGGLKPVVIAKFNCDVSEADIAFF